MKPIEARSEILPQAVKKVSGEQTAAWSYLLHTDWAMKWKSCNSIILSRESLWCWAELIDWNSSQVMHEGFPRNHPLDVAQFTRLQSISGCLLQCFSFQLTLMIAGDDVCSDQSNREFTFNSRFFIHNKLELSWAVCDYRLAIAGEYSSRTRNNFSSGKAAVSTSTSIWFCLSRFLTFWWRFQQHWDKTAIERSRESSAFDFKCFAMRWVRWSYFSRQKLH